MSVGNHKELCMGKRSVFLAIAAICVFWGSGVLAQPNDPPSMVPGNQSYYWEHPEEIYRGPYDRRWYRDRADDYRQNRLRGAGPGRDLQIGRPLPREYRHRQYAIDNWRSHRLVAPPAGYGWYQAGDDYILVELATGIIAQVLLSR
jgi:Ni/Co efflux regulator RcnB